MKLLVVKTTSMGDVVHALPAVSDALRERAGLQVDWLVETPFAPIVRLHPGVQRVLPLAWRKWRKTLWRRDVREALQSLRRDLREARYDLVIDLQGLLKSAWWGRQAQSVLAGYDAASAREPLAAWMYARTAAVPLTLHAIERCRRLMAAHLGYAPPQAPAEFGIVAPAPSWQPPAAYAVLIPNASRPEKLWPEARWAEVGRRLAALQWTPVVLWGSGAEQLQARRIASACGGVVPPFLDVAAMAAVLAQARQVVGLDTGFSHLAAALGRPTLGIYCDHEPGLTGITGPGPDPVVASIGGRGQVPALDDVMALLQRQLQR